MMARETADPENPTMSAFRLPLPRALGVVALAAGTIFAAGGAQAQVFFETWSERFTVPLYEPAPRYRSYRVERERRLHPSLIIDELEDRGFRNLVVVARQPDVYVIEGVSPRTGRVRLVVDAFDGEILQRDAIRRSEAGVVGEDREPTVSTLPASPSRIAVLPTPPVRRAPAVTEPVAPKAEAPAVETPKVAGPLPAPVAAPQRPAPPALPATRPPSADWNPINSVPVAPLL